MYIYRDPPRAVAWTLRGCYVAPLTIKLALVLKGQGNPRSLKPSLLLKTFGPSNSRSTHQHRDQIWSPGIWNSRFDGFKPAEKTNNIWTFRGSEYWCTYSFYIHVYINIICIYSNRNLHIFVSNKCKYWHMYVYIIINHAMSRHSCIYIYIYIYICIGYR